jgi:hypothetical protein
VATIDSGLYGALATVAAITTALQAAVGLTPLNDFSDLRRKMDDSSRGQPAYDKARSDAVTRLRAGILLNAPAAVVNAAVLLSWVGLGIFQCGWVLWLPWIAVLAAALFLLGCAAVGIWKLRDLSRE